MDREAPANKWPMNQAALRWLKAAQERPGEDSSYAVQLAWWGLEKGGVRVSRPLAPHWPDHYEVEMFVGRLLRETAETASRYLLSNANMYDEDEQEGYILSVLERAKTPEEAADAMVEEIHGLMIANSDC